MWIAFKPKVLLWICGHWPWGWAITQVFLSLNHYFTDKWNRFYKLPRTNNAPGLLVVLTCSNETTIFLLILKTECVLSTSNVIGAIFPLVSQRFCGVSAGHYNPWFIESSVRFSTSVFLWPSNIALWLSVNNKFVQDKVILTLTLYIYLKINVIHE